MDVVLVLVQCVHMVLVSYGLYLHFLAFYGFLYLFFALLLFVIALHDGFVCVAMALRSAAMYRVLKLNSTATCNMIQINLDWEGKRIRCMCCPDMVVPGD